VTMLTHFCTEGSSQTARRTLAYLVRHPTWPCEWRQCFIPLFYEYLLHTGDLELVADHYDFLRDKASFHHLIKEGLIREFPQERTIDWPAIYRDGYEFGPAEAVPNAYAYWDLELLARLADWLGKEQEARSLEQAAADLRAGFNRELFDESSGLYVDSVGSRHSSLHANLFALRFGLVPPQRVQACLNLIKSKGVVCGVFTMQFLLETLFMHGEDQAAVELMTRDGNRSWLEMIHHGATATTETWISDQNANMTWCHPWASSPANLIVRHLFGLRPTAPGWSTYTFDPRPGGLQEGKLSLLTPRGWMHAGFQRQEGEYRFDLQPSLEPHLAKAADSGRSPKARPMSLSVSR